MDLVCLDSAYVASHMSTESPWPFETVSAELEVATHGLGNRTPLEDDEVEDQESSGNRGIGRYLGGSCGKSACHEFAADLTRAVLAERGHLHTMSTEETDFYSQGI